MENAGTLMSPADKELLLQILDAIQIEGADVHVRSAVGPCTRVYGASMSACRCDSA